MLSQRCDIHMLDMQRDLVECAQAGAELRPRIGIRADAVMDMQCGKPPGEMRRKFMQQMQQHHRTPPAAQADQNGTVRGEQRCDARRDSFGEIRACQKITLANIRRLVGAYGNTPLALSTPRSIALST